MNRVKQQTHIGQFIVPAPVRDYCERNQDKLIIEQTAFDAVNGYALGIETHVSIQRYAEYCPVCGWHSLNNPNQKRLMGESRHRLRREYVTIFAWDDLAYDARTLDEAFEEFQEKEGAQ